LCGRGRHHLSTFDICSMADWSLITDRRPDNSMHISISCCCGSHIIHPDSEVITVNSDYTCCAERLMLNLKGVVTND